MRANAHRRAIVGAVVGKCVAGGCAAVVIGARRKAARWRRRRGRRGAGIDGRGWWRCPKGGEVGEVLLAHTCPWTTSR